MVLSVRKAAIPRPEKMLPSGRELGCEREKKKRTRCPRWLVGWLAVNRQRRRLRRRWPVGGRRGAEELRRSRAQLFFYGNINNRLAN